MTILLLLRDVHYSRWFAYLLLISGIIISKVVANVVIEDVIPNDYNHLHVPKIHDKPVVVNISLHFANVRSIDESDLTFSVSVTLFQMWVDYRLQFPKWSEKWFELLDSNWKSRLWNPNIFFVNSVDGKLDNIMGPSSFFWLTKFKSVFFFNSVLLKLSCEMDLSKFPHDEQKCGVKIASGIFSDANVVLNWMNFGRKHSGKQRGRKAVGLPQFFVGEAEYGECHSSIGQFNASCLEATLTLKRRSGYYLINVYIPTILIVVMSMLTFWIPPDAVPARVTLGVTSLLTIITKQYQASLPNVSYIVALNVWLSCCIGFVFCSLLEYAAVIVMTSKEKKTEFNGIGQHFVLPVVQLQVNGTWTVKKNSLIGKKKLITPKLLDYISRVIFPVGFVLFCAIYWSIYDK